MLFSSGKMRGWLVVMSCPQRGEEAMRAHGGPEVTCGDEKAPVFVAVCFVVVGMVPALFGAGHASSPIVSPTWLLG